MKVCTIAPAFNRFGGVPYVARNLVAELSKRGVENFVITDDEKAEDVKPDLDKNMVKIYSIYRRKSLFPISLMEFALKGIPVLTKLHREHNFDLIHMHGNYITLPVLAKMLKKIDVPLLETVHGTYLNEINHYFKYPKFRGKAKYCVGVYIDHLIQKLFSKKADKIITVSSKSAEELIQYFGFEKDRIILIPNGVNLDELKSEKILPTRVKFGIPESANIILSVGDIVPRKGAHILIKALPYIHEVDRDTYVVFIGGHRHKGYFDYLKKLIRSIGVENYVNFTGLVSRAETLSWYRECNVFASPSYSEGCAINILEAAAHGKPIAATDVGGARDVLGELGFYAEPNNPRDFARAVIEALNNREVGNKIRKRIENKFTWDKIAERVYKIYQEVI